MEITFEFDYSRNFTAIHLHMNNYFTKDVQVSPFAPLPALFRKLRAPGNYRKFHDHTFADASVLLRGFKNIFLAIYKAILATPVVAPPVRQLNTFIDSGFLNVALSLLPNYFHPRGLSL